MHPTPVSFASDRSLRVPETHVVRTAYVDVFCIRLECRDRMAVGDVGVAYQKLLQLGNDEQWPCPTGRWSEDGKTFLLADGRHQWVASVMLGREKMLVCWLEATQ